MTTLLTIDELEKQWDEKLNALRSGGGLSRAYNQPKRPNMCRDFRKKGKRLIGSTKHRKTLQE